MIERVKKLLRGGTVESAKALGAVAYAALLFAPHAVEHSLETTTVDTMIGEFPAELSFSANYSQINLLNAATIYADKTKADIGMNVKVDGIPRIDTSQKIDTIISPQRFSIYSSLANSPQEAVESYQETLIDEAKENALKYDLMYGSLAGLALYGGMSSLKWRQKFQTLNDGKERSMCPLLVSGLAVTALATSSALADTSHQAWADEFQIPKTATTIQALDTTGFRGAKTDNPSLVNRLNQAISFAEKLSSRRKENLSNYLEVSKPALQEQLQTLDAPKENEKLLFIISDMHGGTGGTDLAQEAIKTLREKFGQDKFNTVLNLGDMVYDPEFQRSAIRDQAHLNPDGDNILAPGNHDIGKTKEYAKKDGMTVLRGRKKIGDISYYGKADPQQTPFLGRPYFPDPDYTEKELGEDTYAALTKERSDIVALHQPAAVRSVLGISSISKFLATPQESLTECKEDGIRDIPAAAINAGHYHQQFPIRIVCNDDGTWTVINVQGTGGGAEEAPTINNWSDPGSAPIKNVSWRVLYVNENHDLITGYANIVIQPSGIVPPIKRVDIGTPDGAPFAVERSLKTK